MRPRALSLGQATLASLAVDLLGGAVTLIAAPRLVHGLGPAAYGVLGLLTVVAGQLGVLQLGVGPAATRLVAEARGRGDARARSATVHAAALLACLASLVVALIFLVLARRSLPTVLAAAPTLRAEAVRATAPALLIIAAQPLLGALQGVVTGDERFGWAALLRLSHGALRPGLAVLAVALHGGIYEVLWAQGVHDVALVLASALLALRGGVPSTTTDRRQALRALLPLGFQFACLGAVTALVLDAEKMTLSVSRAPQELTYYNVPYGAILRVAALGGALGGVLLPRLSFASAAKDPALLALVARANRLTVAAMATALLPALLLTPELLTLWLGADFAAQATRPTRILLCAMAVNAAGLIPGAVLRARSRPWNIVLLYGLQVPLHLLLVAFFVRRLGITGAALAWGLRATLDTLAERVLADRSLRAPIARHRDALLPGAILGALGLVCETTAAPLWLRLVGIVVIGAALLRWLLRREDLLVLWRALPTVLPPPDRGN